jgi:gamma-glutamyltranspeptidase
MQNLRSFGCRFSRVGCERRKKGLMDLIHDPAWMPYPSRRNVIYGSRGMVCTSHPLAAQAGLEILKLGGNAVDAIVAAAAALTVVEPTSNGLGSDALRILWKDGKLRGLNASGPIPKAVDMKLAAAEGWTAGCRWRIPASLGLGPCDRSRSTCCLG